MVSLLPFVGAARAQEPAAVTVPDSIPPAPVLAGSDLYNGGSCVGCHAVAGVGTGRRGPDLADVEWLHSEGDFDGIFRTIMWGVPMDRMKAVTPRPFEMHPRGGMNGDREQLKALAAYVWSLSRLETARLIADQLQFLELVRTGRVEEAIAHFRAANATHGNLVLVPERGLNALGYEVLEQRHDPRAAVLLFTLNVVLHPTSGNVYDSLAEAQLAVGDRAAAIRNYARALALDPDNTGAAEKLKELRGE